MTPFAKAEQPRQTAFFGIKLINTSLEPVDDSETNRIAAVEQQLVSLLRESGRYVFVDTNELPDQARLYDNLAHCNGCDSQFARELGADFALSGEIQKTSNLILHISIYLRDADTGALVDGGSADIRGNTDKSWERGIRYIVKNRILRD
ncbi:MAG: DUF3280 domain-containing protein [Pseudomonadota bacterium]